MGTMAQENATFYYCDPEKNTECRKTCCAHCLTITEGGVCFITCHREFAREDVNGEPVIYNERRRPQNDDPNFHLMEI